MKKILLTLIITLISSISFAQKTEEMKKSISKIDEFTSKTGVIIKFIDYSLPDLKHNYGASETKIRKVISGNEIAYFYLISKEGKYDTKTASIAYEDLIEVIKATSILKSESLNDSALTPDYLENKFVTDDGFKLGYYISKGKLVWFLVLEKYGSNNTIYIKDISNIEKSFDFAKQKIEILKK